MTVTRLLTHREKAALGTLARTVARADEDLSEARTRQTEKWVELLEHGVGKTDIAKASNLTISALNMRLNRLERA